MRLTVWQQIVIPGSGLRRAPASTGILSRLCVAIPAPGCRRQFNKFNEDHRCGGAQTDLPWLAKVSLSHIETFLPILLR